MKRTLFDFAFKIKTTNRETPDEHVCQKDASQSAVPAALTEKESETDLRKDTDSSDGDSGMRKKQTSTLFEFAFKKQQPSGNWKVRNQQRFLSLMRCRAE